MSRIGAGVDVLVDRLKAVRERLAAAAERAGRDPSSVRLIAVSKTVPAARVREAILAGVEALGENYVQEARTKMADLADLPVAWHFIGRLQTNKAKDVIEGFSLIHSVDRLKLARELDRRAGLRGRLVPILIQVNLSGEETKGGAAESEALDLIRAAAGLEHLEVKGLMTMPPFFDDPDRARPFFRSLARLAEAARQRTGLALPELSMGMSGDFEAAIEEGATLVRVGTAIFGRRS